MKKLFTAIILYIAVVPVTGKIAAQQLEKLWETDSTFKVPESTLYYPAENVIFVSNIDGQPGEKDLKGSISKLGADGKTIQEVWATNLSAPKGMAIHQNKLFVADIDEVVVLDLGSGKVMQGIPVPGAVFLNDVTVHSDGTVYVSDSRTGKVHQIKGTTVTTYMENKNGVNGLLVSGDDLYLAVKDTLWKADKNKNLTRIADGIDASSDGIIETSDKDLIVSCWSGIIYYINKDGSKKVLIDTRKEKSNTADIGFDVANNILYVPTFFKNKVVAYKVSK
ncbi:MAG: ATP/GTP-binding protein [Ferruginibacter sp.]